MLQNLNTFDSYDHICIQVEKDKYSSSRPTVTECCRMARGPGYSSCCAKQLKSQRFQNGNYALHHKIRQRIGVAQEVVEGPASARKTKTTSVLDCGTTEKPPVCKAAKSTRNTAGMKITPHDYSRGYRVWKLDPPKQLRIIGKVREELKNMVSRMAETEQFEKLCRDSQERLTWRKNILASLLKLESIHGAHPVVREVRKSVAKELLRLQELLEATGDVRLHAQVRRYAKSKLKEGDHGSEFFAEPKLGEQLWDSSEELEGSEEEEIEVETSHGWGLRAKKNDSRQERLGNGSSEVESWLEETKDFLTCHKPGELISHDLDLASEILESAEAADDDAHNVKFIADDRVKHLEIYDNMTEENEATLSAITSPFYSADGTISPSPFHTLEGTVMSPSLEFDIDDHHVNLAIDQDIKRQATDDDVIAAVEPDAVTRELPSSDLNSEITETKNVREDNYFEVAASCEFIISTHQHLDSEEAPVVDSRKDVIEQNIQDEKEGLSGDEHSEKENYKDSSAKTFQGSLMISAMTENLQVLEGSESGASAVAYNYIGTDIIAAAAVPIIRSKSLTFNKGDRNLVQDCSTSGDGVLADRQPMQQILQDNRNIRAVLNEVLQWGKQQDDIVRNLVTRIEQLEWTANVNLGKSAMTHTCKNRINGTGSIAGKRNIRDRSCNHCSWHSRSSPASTEKNLI